MAYTTRVQTSPDNGRSAVQAAGESTGTFRTIAEGEYEYTFVAKAVNADRTVTHSIGAYGSRNLSEFDLGTQYDDDVFNFVPDGSAVSVVRDVIKTASCNDCHHALALHGGSRRTMELCVLCHTPQTIDADTGHPMDMPVMTHKMHMEANLPSVPGGGKYVIIGNRQSVHDYSKVVFPPGAQWWTTCHEQEGPNVATQSANLYNANRAACGACHDDVDFNTGFNHIDLPQYTDNQCKNCHVPHGELEFEASILGAHTIPRLAQVLPGIVFGDIRFAGEAAAASGVHGQM